MIELHGILFNMIIIYSFALGIYAAVLAAQGKSISGNFWGSIAIFSILAAVTTVIGAINAASGARLQDGQNRLIIYFLYMAFLIVIMPGLFSMLRGRDDRQAAIYFSLLALFNASVAFSMAERGLAIWIAAG